MENKYIGDFENNKPHGKGRLFQKDKIERDGDWKQGKFTGFGWEIFKDGSKYEGEYVNTVIEGKGVLYEK